MSEHRGYSNWDHWIHTGNEGAFASILPGKPRAQARCRMRTELVQGTNDGGEADLELLSRDLGAWHMHWRSTLFAQRTPKKNAAFANLTVNRMMLRTSRPVLVFCWLILLMAYGPVLIGSSAQPPVLVFLLMPFVFLPFLIWMRPMFYLLRSLVHGTCPDCEYPLKELPDAIELPGEMRTGPAVCPECGCPWPLIPPRPPK